MKLYLEGERSAAICGACRSKVSTRMEYRDYTPTGWTSTVPDVMVAVCETCGEIVSVPHQSTYKINAYRSESQRVMMPIGVRVPRLLEETLNLVVTSLGGPQNLVMPALVRYYIRQVSKSAIVASEVAARCEDFLTIGRADRRIVVKVPPSQIDDVMTAMRAAGVRSKARLFKGIVALAATDCEVEYTKPQGWKAQAPVDEGSKARGAFLRELAGTL